MNSLSYWKPNINRKKKTNSGIAKQSTQKEIYDGSF